MEIARHGRGHLITPSEINFRANIYAMKKLGVERILSVSAVGSLREDYRPMDMALPLQFFDRTRGRVSTFFGGGIVAHVGFSDPMCPSVVDDFEAGCSDAGVAVHRGGTYVCMEGPAFSTTAESNAYRRWGMDIIGMTTSPEAFLAREAEISEATDPVGEPVPLERPARRLRCRRPSCESGPSRNSPSARALTLSCPPPCKCPSLPNTAN